MCRKTWVAGKYAQRTPPHTPGRPLALADALAAAVEAHAHTQHSGITGTFAECVAARSVPLIVTGLNDPADVRATWRAGFDDHVSKPVSAQALDRVVDRAMRRSAMPPTT